MPAAIAFGMETPTLRWVRDDGVTDIYVDGLTTAAFLETTGLQLSLHKGAYVLSKRLSRALRPYYVSGLFAPEEVVIQYLDELDDDGLKVWDGAGVISRQMLKKMMLSDRLPPAKRARLERELDHAQRVEFTILTANGQDKGHAIVADTLTADGRSVDFLLPRDSKGELKLVGGQTFVGIDFVHGKKEMRLDIQSLINLHPFFEDTQLMRWLKQEGDLFVDGIETGSVGDMPGRIDSQTTLEEVTGWHVREFLACGGQPLWSPSIVKSIVGQHLKRLRHSTLNKMRLPIPGGRQYVMPVAVGQAAGLTLTVPRGQIQIDPARATAWVNDEDWVALVDSPADAPAGIADILGGADNDDALWLHPFTDHDGQQTVLAWRSPNQVGEYVVLKPTASSAALEWATTGEPIICPAADSRRLPPRTDSTQPEYLNLVAKNGRLSNQPYSIAALDEAVMQAEANQGILGMTCNSLMVHKALFDSLPPRPPAPLEEVVDAAVKTGADLSQVKAHIQTLVAKRDSLMQIAVPPQAVVNSVTAEDIKRGSGLNQAYGRTLRELGGKRPFCSPTWQDMAAARDTSVAYLSRFHPRQHPALLRGAMVSAAGGKRKGGDAVCWLADKEGDVDLAQKALNALREVGVLDEIDTVNGRLLVYPNAEAW